MPPQFLLRTCNVTPTPRNDFRVDDVRFVGEAKRGLEDPVSLSSSIRVTITLDLDLVLEEFYVKDCLCLMCFQKNLGLSKFVRIKSYYEICWY